MKINKAGVLLFFVSSFLSLVILEFGLRGAGFLFNESRTKIYYSEDKNLNSSYDGERDYERFYGSEKAKEIWAIGDSFTNAGNVESDESYPAYLFRLLEAKNYNYNVLNLGQCEDPTWGVYERLKSQLEIGKKPALVVVLVGSSDPFYQLYGVKNYNMKDKGDQKVLRFEMKKKSWIEGLRVFKAYRHIKLSLEAMSISRNSDQINEFEFQQLSSIYNDVIDRVKKEKGLMFDWSLIEGRVFELLKSHRSLLDGSNLNGDNYEFKFKDKARFVFNTLVIPRVRVYSGRLDHIAALETLLKFSKDFPEFFWSNKRNDFFSLNLLSQLFRFQSQFTAFEVLEAFKNSTKTNLKLRNNKFYKFAEKTIQEAASQEKKVYQARWKTWNKIISLSKKFNFKIVVQNYGSSFTSANEMALKVSQNFSIPLVDNHKEFQLLSKEYGRPHLFADDSHFVPLGYELMAKNVMKVLEVNSLISLD
jgi:lysophospholipase L1-like esterase